MARKLNEAEKGFIVNNPNLTSSEIRDKCNKEVSVREIETFRSGVEAANKHTQPAKQPEPEASPDEAPAMANPLDMMRRRDSNGKIIENSGIVVLSHAASELMDNAREVLRPKKVAGYFEKNTDKIHRIK